jgi:hypothetical protein
VARASEKELLARCRKGLRSLADDNPDVLACVAELVKRKSVAGQTAFARIVVKARDEYDPGHREYADTVLDQLVDKWLPKFEGDALVELLAKLDYDVLAADGFEALFEPAFKKAKDPARLVRRLIAHAKEVSAHGGDREFVTALLGKLVKRKPLAKHKAALAAALAEVGSAAGIEAQLDSEDFDVAVKALDRVGRDLSFYEIAQAHHISSTVLCRHIEELSFETIEALLRRAFAEQRIDRDPEDWVGRALWWLFAKDAERAKPWTLALADELGDREFVTKCVWWAERDAEGDYDDAQEVVQDTLAILEGKDPGEEREQAALAERRSNLASKISWELDQGRYDTATAVARGNLSIIDVDTLKDILIYAPLRSTLTAGDYAKGVRIGALLLELIDHKLAQRDEKVANHTLDDFAGLALVAACKQHELDPAFTKRVVELATQLLGTHRDGNYITTYNLCCFHAERGDKAKMLALIPKALALGQKKATFTKDESFRAFRDDRDFKAALAHK